MNEKDRQRVEQCKHEVDESLRDLQTAHGEMKEMLTGMTEEGALLASDIGAAVRGLQFQDRTSQRIAHVVEDLETLRARLSERFGAGPVASDEGFSAYTMHEERTVAGTSESGIRGRRCGVVLMGRRLVGNCKVAAAALPMSKKIGCDGLQTKSASEPPLRGDGASASWRCSGGVAR